MKLVLLPGLDGTGVLFAPLLRVLPSHFSTQVISYPPKELLSYADLLRYVQERVPAGEAYVLLAESFSGPLALELAATHPPNLKAIVLCATFVSNPARFPSRLSPLIGKFAFGLEPPAFFIKKYLLGEAPDDLVESFRSVLRSVSPAVLAQRVRSVLRVDAREAVKKCQLPVLYLVARQDKVIKRRGLAELRILKPEMEVIEVEGPHLLLQQAPERCIKAIDEFVSRVMRSI